MFVKFSEWANYVVGRETASSRRRRKSGFSFQFSSQPESSAIELLESRELLVADILLPPAQAAIVTRTIPRIINGTETTDFPSVGIVGDRDGGYATGTLIAPNWVLTAAHTSDTLTNTGGRFTIGGMTYETEYIVPHSRYNAELLGQDGANDIALWKLKESVVGINPSPLHTGSLRVSQTLTLVGYGLGGDAENGESGEFGTKRVGTTPIDQITATLITFDFQDATESNTAHGDSGGPAFVNVNGTYYVAGVTSGGTDSKAALGDHAYDTKVAAYSGWIQSVMAGSVNWGIEDDFPDVITSEMTPVPLSPAGKGSVSGRLNVAKDIDIFRLDLPDDALVTLRLQGTNGTRTIPDPELTLMDATGTVIVSNDNWIDSVTYSQLVQSLAMGTYYLQVNSSEYETQGTYRLTVEALVDAVGETPETASTMPYNRKKGVSTVVSELSTSTDVDMFSFVADKQGEFDIRLINLSFNQFDPVVTLVDSAGNVLGTTTEHGPTYTQIRFRASNLTEGTRYFVRVEAADGGVGKYQIDAWHIRAKKSKKGKR